MTRVDFYIAPQASPDACLQTACRLTDKAYRLGHRVYIHVEDEQQAQVMNKLLWTFRAGSFIPHTLVPATDAAEHPVLIGCKSDSDQGPEQGLDVLINLNRNVPPFFSRFERVAEIVAADGPQRDEARARFRFYRERGYELTTHQLS